MADQAEHVSGAVKPKVLKHRSPNYPALGLEKALGKVGALVRNKRHYVPLRTAMDQMDYKPDSSTGQQAVAALKYFGLVNLEGVGDKRQIRMSDRAAKIVASHPDRERLIREAALLPPIHREVWDRFYKGTDGLAPDEAIKQYLVWDREDTKFSPESVDGFIEQFKQTIRFAKLDSSDTMPNGAGTNGEDESEAAPDPVGVGDWVQWVSQGMAQFSTPRQVVQIRERDGEKFVCVLGDDGKEGWAPMSQITVEKPAEGVSRGREQAPPFQPPAVHGRFNEPSGDVEESRWKLPSGHAVLRYPAKMTERDFKVLQKQVELLRFAVIGEDDDVDSDG